MKNVNFLTSIFGKGAAALVLCIGAVSLTLALLNFSSSMTLSRMAVEQRATEVTGLLAKLGGGPLKFSKADILQSLLDDSRSHSDGSQDLAIAIDANKTIVAGDLSASEHADEVRQLALAAIDTQKAQVSADGLAVAVPVFFGTEATPVGAIATHWNMQAMQAFLASRTERTLAVVTGVFAFAMLLGILFLRRAISQPLARLGGVIRRIADMDLAAEVPFGGRRDEVGAIASALHELREHLAQGADAATEAYYKSAAFEGSSAAMMLLNPENILQYSNPAMTSLLTKLTPFFRVTIPDFDAASVVGRSLDAFLKRHENLRRRLVDRGEDTFEEIVALADYRIALRFSPVRTRDGGIAGRVIEWADVTEQVLNAAILQSINSDQARAEFALDGALTYCNARFAEALNTAAETLAGRNLMSLLQPDWITAESRQNMLVDVAAGSSILARFAFLATGSERATLEAGLSCVRDTAGQPLKYLLLGRDITVDEARLAASETERAEMQRDLTRVVESLKVALRRMRDGDLSHRISEAFAARYEDLRADYNGTMDTLTTTMRELVDAANGIHGEARDISTTAGALSRRSESTAATLEETAAALDQLTTSVQSAAEGALRTDREVTDARRRAEKSGEIVMETVEAMDQISSFSEKISSITKVIEDIAFQTNLLALNAGVEAARAGEAGRGFAVVASEVRALAQRCTEAAREINELIADSGSHVKRGVDLVGQTGLALKEIVQSIAGIATLVSEIAASSRQQSTGLAEINAAVNDLDQSTQQNAARLEEATAASQSLTNDAMMMVETVSHFQLGSMGGAARPAARAPRREEPTATFQRQDRTQQREAQKPQASAPRRRAGGASPEPSPVTDADGWSDY